MPSPVKAEVAKIVALSVLLLLGVGYLLRMDSGDWLAGEGPLFCTMTQVQWTR